MWIVLGILICVFIFSSLLIKTRSNFDISNKYPIDIVYTWVEDNNEFNEEKNYWFNNSKNNYKLRNSIDTKRFEDNQELKYSIRSVEKYFPYFNNIYIVVKDGQKPSYINFNNPKIHLVNHSEIIPSEYLPTFNSMAIECYLHHIPNLSEYYLYFNDDILMTKKVDPFYFINFKTGIPYSLHAYSHKKSYKNKNYDYENYFFEDGWHVNFLMLNKLCNYEIDRYTVSHIPKMYKKTLDFEIEKRLKQFYFNDDSINSYDKTGMSKFRRNDNLYLVAFLKQYLYVNWFKGDFKKTQEYYMSSSNKMKNLLRDYDKINFMCIQSVLESQKQYYLQMMEYIYPKKSSFEF
jgi:hypothetical protein